MAKNNKRNAPGAKPSWPGIAWMVALAAGAAGAIAWTWPCFRGAECSGASHQGLGLGFLGLAALLISAIYSLRKRRPSSMLFTLENWLYAHAVLGTLSLVLVIAHSGFHLRNQVAVIALCFLAVTTLSGVIGLFLLYFLPRTQVRNEAAVLLPVDLCKRLSRLHVEISDLCSEKGGVFLTVYNERVIPLYRTEAGKGEPPAADLSPWADQAPGESEAFMVLAAKVEEAHDLLVLLGRHLRFQWWIRGWLLFHLPATLGTLVFTLLHVVSALWFGAL